MLDIGLLVPILIALAVVIVANAVWFFKRQPTQSKPAWPDRPKALPRPEGGFPERFQVVVDSRPTPDDPVLWRPVESTDDAKEAKAGRLAYLKAGYRAGIVADGVFRG